MAEGSDSLAIIGIPDFNFIEVRIENYEPYETILKNLSNIYTIM